MRATALLVLVALLLVGGCRRGFDCPPGKVCLRYMAWGNPEQLAVELEMVERFNAQNPDIHVRLFRVPGSSFGQKMVTMLASRTAPDVLRVDHYAFPSLVDRDYFVDLTPFAEADPTFDPAEFWPTAIEEGTVNGRLYGLNVLYGGMLIYYNKTLFQAAGLPDPWEQFQRGEWTWDSYLAAAKAITRFDERGRPRVFGTSVPAFPSHIAVVRSFGGEMMSPDLRTSLVDSPEAARAYQFMADLVWVHKVSPTPAQGANSAFAFESGKLGMTFDWMGMAPRFRSVVSDFEWDVVPIPRGPAGWHTIIKGNQLVIAANSKHPREAWRFLRFLTGVEAENRLYAEIRRSFPTRIAVARSPKYLETALPPFHMHAFVQTIENARTLPIDARWGEWTQVLNSEVDNLMAGRERDAEAVLARAKREIDRVLAEDPGF